MNDTQSVEEKCLQVTSKTLPAYLEECREKGISIRRIAGSLGVNFMSVFRWMKRNNFKWEDRDEMRVRSFEVNIDGVVANKKTHCTRRGLTYRQVESMARYHEIPFQVALEACAGKKARLESASHA